MKRLIAAALSFVLIAFSAQAYETELVEAARVKTVAWLALTDAGDYESSWDSASASLKTAISKEDWEQSIGAVRTPIGVLETRDLSSSDYSTDLPGAPDGEYVVFQFHSSFEFKATALETVTAMKDDDGVWRVAGYYIK